MLTKAADVLPMRSAELDRLAQTPVFETLQGEELARALTSPPFVLLASTSEAHSQDASAPVACLNFRDTASNERTPEVRPKRIYRAGKSAFDSAHLAQMGIVKVYDLRSEAECLRDPHLAPDEMPGIEVVWIAPLATLADHFSKEKGTAEQEASQQAIQTDEVQAAVQNILVESYMSILQSHKQTFRQMLLDVADLQDDITADRRQPQAILLHCTAGKDRTGVAAAMLLSLAGCTPQGIASDYALTRIGIEPARERLLKAMQAVVPNFSVDDPRFRALSESRSEDMLLFLDRVQETYGGLGQYAKDVLGLDDLQIQQAIIKLHA